MKVKHIYYSIIGLAVVLVSSCAKQQIDINTTQTTVAAVNFIQGSPDQPGIGLFFYNTPFNTSPITYGQYTSYLPVNSGIDTVRVANATTGKVILSAPFNFVQSTAYSLFLANTTANPEFLLLNDVLAAPTTGNATIRFVNLSPDAPAVDLVIKGGATIASNLTYKSATSFLPLPGNVTYTIEVHQAGTSTVLATLSNVKLQLSYVYTIWFHGLVNNTSSADALAVDYMTNTYYQ